MDLEKDSLPNLEKQTDDSPKDIFQSADLFENLEFYKEHQTDYKNKNESLAKTIAILTCISGVTALVLPIYSVDYFAGAISGLISVGSIAGYWDLLKEKLNNKTMRSIWHFSVSPLTMRRNIALDRCNLKKEDIKADLNRVQTKVIFAKLYQYFSKENLNSHKPSYNMERINNYLTNIINDYHTNNLNSVFDNALSVNSFLKDYFNCQEFKQATDNMAIDIIRIEKAQKILDKSIFKKRKNYQI